MASCNWNTPKMGISLTSLTILLPASFVTVTFAYIYLFIELIVDKSDFEHQVFPILKSSWDETDRRMDFSSVWFLKVHMQQRYYATSMTLKSNSYYIFGLLYLLFPHVPLGETIRSRLKSFPFTSNVNFHCLLFSCFFSCLIALYDLRHIMMLQYDEKWLYAEIPLLDSSSWTSTGVNIYLPNDMES